MKFNECNINWCSTVNWFYESRTLTLLLSISWLSSRKLWVLVALPLVGWHIYSRDSDFAASDKKEGDWAEWIKERLQPNVSPFSERFSSKTKRNLRFGCKRSLTHSAQCPVILVIWNRLSFVVVNGSSLQSSSRLFLVMSRNPLTKKWLLIIELFCYCFHNRFKQRII